MSEASKDSPPLFTSRRGISEAPVSPDAARKDGILPKPKGTYNFYVNPPMLSAEQKNLYRPISPILPSDHDLLVDEVIGEYRDGNQLYYFARYDSGIAHKACPFLEKHKDLVDRYKRKKVKNQIKPFDPTASYVHPLSRIKTKIRTDGSRATSYKSSKAQSDEIVPDSEEEYSSPLSEVSDDEDIYSDGGTPAMPRRSGRREASDALPFSPKKTRSQRVLVIHDSDSEPSEDYQQGSRRATRRSTRKKTTTKVKLDVDDGSSEESAGVAAARKLRKRNNDVRPKIPPPAYGNFRSIEDLDGDPYPEDEENILLREHRDICEKCHLKPAHMLLAALAKKPKRRKRRKTSEDEFEESDGEEKFNSLGGWVRCLKCPVSAHWRCLAASQREDITKAVRARAQTTVEQGKESVDYSQKMKRVELGVEETTEFSCGACVKGGICMGCMETALLPQSNYSGRGLENSTEDGKLENGDDSSPNSSAHELLFRCFTCKRLAHYAHLPKPGSLPVNATVGEVAVHYQIDKSWLCADCSSYRYTLDKIIAWRPYPPNAKEPPRRKDEPAYYKDQLPREYLVKWSARSYRRTQWVPHMWLLSTSAQKLKNFLTVGTKLELLKEPSALPNADEEYPSFELTASRASSSKPLEETPTLFRGALPDAEKRIPSSWKTIDRILDMVLWYPSKPKGVKRGKNMKRQKRTTIIDSDSDAEAFNERIEEEKAFVNEHGERPSTELAGTISEWEEQAGRVLTAEDFHYVALAFIKWDGLGYDEATWDTPPGPEDIGYDAFKVSLRRFIAAQNVTVPKLSKAHAEKFDKRVKDGYRKYVLKNAEDLDLGQDLNLKLMPFQVDGFNWLCDNWWKHQHCILADEMGLGKTVQIATFLGNIADRWNAFPALVVVPNSTITNWIREFEKWAPKLRVVPYYGEKKSRDIIQRYELFHKEHLPSDTPAKFHVLVTTYETVTGTGFSIFKNQPRWEVLVVDEGQRLKSDASLLFKKLNELNSIHRIIMTGTPLNNNIRELFNLMNFLDPNEWRDLEALEKEHEELTEELVKQLHNRLRPYFLRRIKSEVLQLPPKNEIIIPVSMAPLQKEVYRSILSHNADLLKGLARPSKLSGMSGKTRINNVLMQLRKCLQHPYLFAEDIEPRGLDVQETHHKLIDASAKLRFLKALLPKLKERGHRILLFSQFVIALDVIEDFLRGEGHKYLRLDGNTKNADRQRGMDEFNRPGSDVFVYLLTTRAGGVGINLFTADTVIIFDPDFNPHQDLQAIARAYRFGQTKTCLVFKLMVKDSAEERIMQIGKKKLVLDHLIVQKMDDDDETGGDNVKSILTYGAQALFEADQGSKDIIYSDQDIEKLIEKTEKEGDQQDVHKEGMTFAFAKVWAADKDSLEEIEDDDQTDSWAQTLLNITAEREKQQSHEDAISGRGARRKAADIAKSKMRIEDTPVKTKSKSSVKKTSKSVASEGSAYMASDVESSDSAEDEVQDEDFVIDLEEKNRRKSKGKKSPFIAYEGGALSTIQNAVQPSMSDCGLCGGRHSSGVGECSMTDLSENLAEYREMLILHADDEHWDERTAAIKAIDDILSRRGHTNLIAGQPLSALRKPADQGFVNNPPTLNAVVSRQNSTSGQQGALSLAASTGALSSLSSNQPTRTLGPPVKNLSLEQSRTTLTQSSHSDKQAKESSMPSRPPMKGDMGRGKQASMSGNHAAEPSSTSGSSKRPLPSSTVDESSKKKSKMSSAACIVCGGPAHQSLAKECPIVLEGPKSVATAIRRLDPDPNFPNNTPTVDILRSIYRKQMSKQGAT